MLLYNVKSENDPVIFSTFSCASTPHRMLLSENLQVFNKVLLLAHPSGVYLEGEGGGGYDDIRISSAAKSRSVLLQA